MKLDISRLRQQLLEAEESRKDSVQAILQAQGPLRCGSLVSVLRKCGKPTCRCAKGEGHRATYLSIKQQGTTRMLYIPAYCLETITHQANGYRHLRKHRARLAKLAQESLQIVDCLQMAMSSTEAICDNGERGGGKKRKKTRGKG
jgi:hypothetical protein